MSYESDIASGAFTPSERALEVDAIIAASTPQNDPDNWRFLGTVGWIYVGRLGQESSRAEYTAWVNRGLNYNNAFIDVYDEPDAGSTTTSSSGGLNYMTQAELDAYNQANGTSFKGNYLSTHPNTGEPGMWTWDPQVGWRDDTKWTQTTTGPNFSANNPNAPADDPPPNNNGGGTNNNGTNNGTNNGGEPQPIGWYWTGSEWLPFYQGEAPPAGLPQGWVAPVSTKPTSPPQNAGTNNGGSDPNSNGGSTPDPQPEPEPPPLFTPDGSMFFQGLFNASDVLYRDGGTIQSPYYNNARTNILNQLAEQAAASGRTQNTAEEIRLAQNQTPSLSASGLFNPDYAALLKGMGIG